MLAGSGALRALRPAKNHPEAPRSPQKPHSKHHLLGVPRRVDPPFALGSEGPETKARAARHDLETLLACGSISLLVPFGTEKQSSWASPPPMSAAQAETPLMGLNGQAVTSSEVVFSMSCHIRPGGQARLQFTSSAVLALHFGKQELEDQFIGRDKVFITVDMIFICLLMIFPK